MKTLQQCNKTLFYRLQQEIQLSLCEPIYGFYFGDIKINKVTVDTEIIIIAPGHLLKY